MTDNKLIIWMATENRGKGLVRKRVKNPVIDPVYVLDTECLLLQN